MKKTSKTDERFRRKEVLRVPIKGLFCVRETSKPGVCQKTISGSQPRDQWHDNLNIIRRNRIGSHHIASCYDVAGGTMEIKMTIIYEKADGLIQASVAELPGAISLGADVEEARRNLDEAIEMVLEGNRLLAEDVTRDKISSEEIAFRAA
jgi:predicted RNase H-like HicB family nuclease